MNNPAALFMHVVIHVIRKAAVDRPVRLAAHRTETGAYASKVPPVPLGILFSSSISFHPVRLRNMPVREIIGRKFRNYTLITKFCGMLFSEVKSCKGF